MFNKSAVKDHTAKADHVLDTKEAQVVGRENIQRLRQVKEVIRISRAPRVMSRYHGGGVCVCVCVGGGM